LLISGAMNLAGHNGKGRADVGVTKATDAAAAQMVLMHPAWLAFIRYCQALGHGEIERLKIQDGIPVLAELAQKKVEFT
jgi:hypothetical protein